MEMFVVGFTDVKFDVAATLTKTHETPTAESGATKNCQHYFRKKQRVLIIWTEKSSKFSPLIRNKAIGDCRSSRCFWSLNQINIS